MYSQFGYTYLIVKLLFRYLCIFSYCNLMGCLSVE